MIEKITNKDIGRKIKYIPYHAFGDINHKDCEEGTITSFNENYIFATFNRGVSSKACLKSNLIFVD
jgi:hypothetical protein